MPLSDVLLDFVHDIPEDRLNLAPQKLHFVLGVVIGPVVSSPRRRSAFRVDICAVDLVEIHLEAAFHQHPDGEAKAFAGLFVIVDDGNADKSALFDHLTGSIPDNLAVVVLVEAQAAADRLHEPCMAHLPHDRASCNALDVDALGQDVVVEDHRVLVALAQPVHEFVTRNLLAIDHRAVFLVRDYREYVVVWHAPPQLVHVGDNHLHVLGRAARKQRPALHGFVRSHALASGDVDRFVDEAAALVRLAPSEDAVQDGLHQQAFPDERRRRLLSDDASEDLFVVVRLDAEAMPFGRGEEQLHVCGRSPDRVEELARNAVLALVRDHGVEGEPAAH